MTEEERIKQLASHGGSLKDMQYALGRLAYEFNVNPSQSGAYRNFVETNPYAQEIVKQLQAKAGNTPIGEEWVNLLKNPALYNAAFERFRGDDIKRQQGYAAEKAFQQAEDFRGNLPGYVEGEVGALRKSLSAQLAETRGAIKQQENARGMLYSGRRQKREGEAQNMAAQTFAEGAGDIAKGAEQQSQELFGRASAIKSGQASAQAGAQGIIDRAKEARQSATNALSQDFSSLLGQGIGEAAGSYSKKTQKQNFADLTGGGHP